MDNAWKEVIGNLYQCILGSHEERVQTITKWLTFIHDDPVKSMNIAVFVDMYSQPYKVKY